MLNLMFVMKTCELKYAQLLNSNNLIALENLSHGDWGLHEIHTYNFKGNH